MNLILAYPNNFKKCAKVLPDELLRHQMKEICELNDRVFNDTDHIFSEEELYYVPQLRWLFKYLFALNKEYKFRFGKTYLQNINEYKFRYNRFKDKSSAFYNGYGKSKWAPATYDSKYGINLNKKLVALEGQSKIFYTIRNNTAVYTKRGEPRGFKYI